ncbi:MAG: hypothetical protein AAF492_27380, partial [Verrucomicrobiota bacterium]
MSRPRYLCRILTLFCCSVAGSGWGEDAKPAEKKAPETHTVEVERFRLQRSLGGILVPDKKHEIILRTEVWKELIVDQVAPHGSWVKKGDVVLKLDTEKIDQTIQDKEKAFVIQELGLARSKLEAEYTKESAKFALEDLRRTRGYAHDDFEYFKDVDYALQKRNAENSLKQSENYLAYQEEELRQLKKMYEDDDLTEETEEIILRRQRDTVEMQKAYVEEWRQFTKKRIETDLPRREKSMELTRTRQDFELKKLESSYLVTGDVEAFALPLDEVTLPELFDLGTGGAYQH